MSEWWTYTLSDFLLFSPQTYYRLFELHNAAIWPAQIPALLAGVVVLASMHGDGTRRGRIVAAVLAACWLWVAWAFHWQRYATINWAATWFAAGFALEALLLIGSGTVRGRLRFGRAAGAIGWTGFGILLFALAVQPFIGPLLGRDWAQVELFATAPDPTAIATLGVLLSTTGRIPWTLLVIPMLWCAISGATLWTMQSPDALLMPVVALFALALALWRAWVRGACAT